MLTMIERRLLQNLNRRRKPEPRMSASLARARFFRESANGEDPPHHQRRVAPRLLLLSASPEMKREPRCHHRSSPPPAYLFAILLCFHHLRSQVREYAEYEQSSAGEADFRVAGDAPPRRRLSPPQPPDSGAWIDLIDLFLALLLLRAVDFSSTTQKREEFPWTRPTKILSSHAIYEEMENTPGGWDQSNSV